MGVAYWGAYWGSLQWGEGPALQGLDAQGKQATRFLARAEPAGFAALAIDLSQYHDNMIAGATWMYETANLTRFDIGTRSTVGLRVEMSTSDVGFLYYRGNGGGDDALEVAAGVVRLYVNGVQRATLAIPGLDSTTREYVIAWAMKPNPTTTGAADAQVSWLYIARGDGSQVDRVRCTHPTTGTTAGSIIVGAATTAGDFDFDGDITAFWYEGRCQSFTEVAVDWIEDREEPETDFQVIDPPLPVTKDSGFGDLNEPYGPQTAFVLRQVRAMNRRAIDPLWTERFASVVTWSLGGDDPYADGPDWRTPPGASTRWSMFLGWSTVAAVPPTVNKAWVKVHVKSWPDSGAAVPLGVRVYSMNRPPNQLAQQGFQIEGEEQPDPFDYRFVGATVTRDDDPGVGSWVELGELPIIRGTGGTYNDKTFLAIAVSIDPLSVSGNDAAERFEIAAVAVTCGYSTAVGVLPGLGGGGFAEG